MRATNRPRFSILAATCLSIVLALGACKRTEAPQPPPPPPVSAAKPAAPPAPAPFRVSSVQVGNAIGTDKRVSTPSTTLAPTDTIYASVASDGAAPSVTLVAKWTYEDGQTVSEQSQTIAPTGPTTTEFHVAKPDGWPTGRYKVEIVANGSPAGAQEFEVK